MLQLNLTPEVERLIATVSTQKQTSVEEFVENAVHEYICDLKDGLEADVAYLDFLLSDGETVSANEARKRLGL